MINIIIPNYILLLIAVICNEKDFYLIEHKIFFTNNLLSKYECTLNVMFLFSFVL